MRRLFAALVATSILAPGIASAACLQPYEGTAMNVAGLKSELMVTALACDTRDRYNSFVLTFRPYLEQEDTALNRYFMRHYGRNWRTEHDSYITQLANVQSDDSIQQGTLFCQHNVVLFNEVLALKTTKDLSTYANDKPMLQPVNYDICGMPHHPVYRPAFVQVALPVSAASSTAKRSGSGSEATANGHPQRGFFGSIAHGIASIF
jgi:hypothetical protein